MHVHLSRQPLCLLTFALLAICVQAVRDSGDTAPTVHVDIDTLTFDRLLIFLEAQALQRQLPGFAIHYLDDLQRVSLSGCI
jgi:hypothetical protein